MYEQDVKADLERFGGNKVALTQVYAAQQQVILNKYGGNFGDIPATSENSDQRTFYRIQAKMHLLQEIGLGHDV